MSTSNAEELFDYIVYIGRFQIFHKGHLSTIKRALKLAKKVIVVIGSSNLPRTVKNPFTAEERKNLIVGALTESEAARVTFTHANDYLYNDTKWVGEIQQRVSALILEKKAKVGIIGLKKDESSFYLDLFPQWKFIGMDETKEIHATELRKKYFEGIAGLFPYEKDVPSSVLEWLFGKFFFTPHYTILQDEYRFLEKYKEQWQTKLVGNGEKEFIKGMVEAGLTEDQRDAVLAKFYQHVQSAPYPVNFVTVDAVVVQSGHVLMVKRGSKPGKGLWALPGGFVDTSETVLTAVIRELKEETRIKESDGFLQSHIIDQHVFDHPRRSERGRTITHAFLIQLPGGPLAKVRGGDDAAKAQWVPLADIEARMDEIYEDHASIIMHMIGKL